MLNYALRNRKNESNERPKKAHIKKTFRVRNHTLTDKRHPLPLELLAHVLGHLQLLLGRLLLRVVLEKIMIT